MTNIAYLTPYVYLMLHDQLSVRKLRTEVIGLMTLDY